VKIRPTAAHAVFFLVSATLGIAHAACERHIVNQSAQPWTVSFEDQNPDSPQHGNVYFVGRPECPQNGPCTIAPNSTATITYTATNLVAAGSIVIKDYTDRKQSFYYNTALFSTDPNVCPKIDHRGRTTPVSLNDPASGDVNIGAVTWN
jgi:hypothetical protein